MKIAEIFKSIQGEGEFAGTSMVFVRTTGCNLRCWFCDTPYTSWEPEGHEQSLQAVLDKVTDYNCRYVVVTGGEPLLQPEIVSLTQRLHEDGCFVTVETAGTVYRPVHADLMSLSPKLSNSTPAPGRWRERHERIRDNRDVTARLIDEYPCQLKFVIDRPGDIDEVEQYLQSFPAVPRENVWLMPQAVTRAEIERKAGWLVEEARTRGFRVSPRLHVELYGNVRGK